MIGSTRLAMGTVLLVGLAACTSLLGDDYEIVPATPASGGGPAAGSGGTPEGGGGEGGEGGAPADCGDGVLEGDESCDDGNRSDGDGCDASCDIEGSCAAPVVLPETSADASRIEWGIEASTSGASQVGVAACDGAALGGGPDRIYSFTLTDTRDVRIVVSAEFASAVRLLAAPCDLGSEVPETGQPEGCATDAPLVFESLPAGSYFVVVDGAGPDDAGSFSLAVDAACPKAALQLAELRIGTPEMIRLANTADSCSVDLGGVFLRLDDSSYPSITVDLSAQLALPDAPEALLPASSEVWLSDVPVAGEISMGDDVPFSPNRGGTVLLCRGPCTDSADGLLDLVAFSEGDAHPSLPTGATFSPSGLSGIAYIYDADHTSYQRTGSHGAPPGFLASDWRVWFFAPTLFYDSFEDGLFDDWTVVAGAATYDVSVVSTHGSRSMHIDGNTGAYTGMYYTLPPIQPTRIQFAVRGTPGASGAVGWFVVGADDVAAEDGMVQFRIGAPNRLIFTVQGASLIYSAYDPLSWNLIAYENIDWQAKTFDLAINGETVGTTRGFWQQDLPHITRVHLYNTSTETSAMAMWDWILMTE